MLTAKAAAGGMLAKIRRRKNLKIYELARDLGVDREALLFLAQSEGIEAKTIAKVLSSAEELLLMEAFERQGGIPQAPVEKEKASLREPVLSNSDQASQEKVTFYDPRVAYEKPTSKKKKIFEKKKKKAPKGLKIKKQNYERPHLPKKHSQKAVRLILGGIVGTVLLLSLGSAFSYSQTQAVLKREGRAILDSGNRSVQKLSELSRQSDYEAQLFTEDFARVYLNVSSKEDEQVKQSKDLQGYYGKAPALLSQGTTRHPSQLNKIQLLSMTGEEARYLVDVTVEEVVVTPAKGKTKATREVKTKALKKVFVVPFGKVKGKYFVSSYPTLEDLTNNRAGDEAKQVELTASSTVSSEVESALNTFIKNVFQAKTSSQKDLDLLASGLRVSTGEKLDSIDYSFFKETSENTYQAVVQASFSSGLGRVPENWVFTIEKSGKTYFAKDFSSVIQENDLENKK